MNKDFSKTSPSVRQMLSKGFDNRDQKRTERESKQVLRLYAAHTPGIHAVAPSNSYVATEK